LIFKGKAETPVYAYVEDKEVELRDASDIWGLGVHDTVKHFRDKYGEKDLTVMAIGPAGENLVKYACWVNEDDRASGRGGTGCVGGSKNLKAVVVKAKKNFPKPKNKEAWKPAQQRALATIMDEANVTSPRKGGLSVYGTNVLMNITNEMGALPAFNSMKTSFGERGELTSGEWVNENILVNNPTCHACPVACKKEVKIEDGPFAGLHMESLEYEPAWSVGANCGNDDARAIAKMIDLANDYGFDAIEIGDVIATLMEATQKGYTNGEGIEFGDVMGMVEVSRKVAYREGIGDIMADGCNAVALKFGHPEIAMTVKGQGIPAYDPRGLKGMGIAYATSNRGACHLRAYTPASELGLIPNGTDPLEWKGKGELTKLFQDLFAFSDSLDLCKFSSFAEGADEYAAQYAAFVGLEEFTADDVLETGERIYNLERHYNNLAGHREGCDYLPERFLNEPSDMPGSEGHVCELALMLDEYYEARGWVNGVVPESKLQELGVL
jgi:aldehyde:ferredoxin oxidoreductase